MEPSVTADRADSPRPAEGLPRPRRDGEAAARPHTLEGASSGLIGDPTGRRIAYLTNMYPSISHTFIRREIEELERRGHVVLRLSIRRSASPLADDADLRESDRTFVCLEARWSSFAAALIAAIARPASFAAATIAMLGALWRSHGSAVRHLAYLLEATVLLREVRRHRCQHVHVHFGTNSAAAARLMRLLGGPPYSLTLHGPDEFDQPRSLDLAAKVGDSAFTIAISSFTLASLQRWVAPGHWDRIKVIRCGVGDPVLKGGSPAADTLQLLSIARLVPQKSLHQLIEAMAIVRRGGVAARLTIVGDGEQRRSLESQIDRLGLHCCVELAGWLPEQAVRRRIDLARALVQPSVAEGIPAVVMEAMAMRRPVIATFVGGVPELVTPGRNGWLVPAGDPVALAAAMTDVLSTPIDRIREMGEAGRQDVRERHDLGKAVAALEAAIVESMAASSR
jgi:glycosyltransferase involved in cell wall biosynthesis